MNIGKLRKEIEGLPDDTPCCYDLWFAEDVREHMAGRLNTPLWDEEAAAIVRNMHNKQDASRGISWDSIEECLPDSVRERLYKQPWEEHDEEE